MIQELREEFWENVKVPGTAADFNQSLERPDEWRISSNLPN
jgi:succinate dehydrogenase / fumarate reductase flavoprotein subunit